MFTGKEYSLDGGMIGSPRVSHQPVKDMPGEDDAGVVLAGGQL